MGKKKKNGKPEVVVQQMTSEMFEPVLDMLEEFLTSVPQLVKLAKFNRDHVAAILNNLTASETCAVLVATHAGKPIGCTVLATIPIWYSKDTVAQELAWWVTPEARGIGAGSAMLKACEEWTQEQRQPVLIMGAVNGSSHVARQYVDRGYRLSESTYSKFFEVAND